MTAVDASGAPITDLAQRAIVWRTDNASLATVSATGLVTGVALGTTTVSATVDGVLGTAALAVRAASVSITPAQPKLAVGETVPLQATAIDAKGVPITGASVSWLSQSPNATVNANGVVTAVAVGTAVIQATVGGTTGTTTVEVVSPLLTVSPSSPTVIVAATQQLVATGATGVVSWSTSDPSVAAVSSTGLLTAKFPGSVTIEARSGPQRGAVPVTVRAASVRITPSPASVRQGETVDLIASVLDANAAGISGVPLVWTSSSTVIATVSTTGRVTGIALGTVTISASGGGANGSTQLAVIAPANATVATVGVSLTTSTLLPGQTTQATAVVRDALGTVLIGRIVSWTTANTAVASVSSFGVVTALSPGTTNIIATCEGKTASVSLTVTPQSIATINVSPLTLSLNIGEVGAFTATPRDASGNVLVGRTIAWSATNISVVTVSATGSVTGVGTGTASVVATSEGKSGSATVTVAIPPPPPNAPTAMYVSYNQPTSFIWVNFPTWTDNSSNESEFRVERTLAGANNWIQLGTTPPPTQATTWFADSNAAEATVYQYRVRACNGGGCSAFSGAMTGAGSLRGPTNLVATRNGGTVQLAWQDNTNKEGFYRVIGWKLDQSGVGTPFTITQLPPNTTAFIAPAGVSGSTGSYGVFACVNLAGYQEMCALVESQKFVF